MLADREERVMTTSTDPDRPAGERPWPYPSYADRTWLGGDRGPDRALATVVRGLRGLVAETGGGGSEEPPGLLAALQQLGPIGERGGWAVLSPLRAGGRPGGGPAGGRKAPGGP